jgi:hypothetical protein
VACSLKAGSAMSHTSSFGDFGIARHKSELITLS